jgi:Mg/Co/Ni transporter MgtE
MRLIAREFAIGFLGGLILVAVGLLMVAVGVCLATGGRP